MRIELLTLQTVENLQRDRLYTPNFEGLFWTIFTIEGGKDMLQSIPTNFGIFCLISPWSPRHLGSR